MKSNQKGVIPLSVLIVFIGILVVIGLTTFVDFRKGIFGRLFPKNPSFAAVNYQIESETSSLTGAVALGTDSDASGGQYIEFGVTSSSGGGPSLGNGTTYYIDCNGSDANNGTSQTTPWASLSKASAAPLQAGDNLLFKRGCSWTGSITLGWTSGNSSNNVYVGAYGTGELPIIQNNPSVSSSSELVRVTGDYITIQELHAKANPYSTDSSCLDNPEGYVLGFTFKSGAQYNTLRFAKATGAWAGVDLDDGSSFNKVLNSTFADNNMMYPLDGGGQGVAGGSGDAGAFGIVIHSSDNEIAYNTISGSTACSHDYYWDGGAIEIYASSGNSASRNNIHHNIATQSDSFSELGKASTGTSSDNVFAYNRFVSDLTDSVFLNTRGEGNQYGPIYNTKVYNNTIYLTGPFSSSRNKGPQGIVCSNCGTNILTAKNNILWANWKSIYSSSSFDESNNIYWKTGGSPVIQIAGGSSVSPTSLKADPLFVTNGSNFDLQSTSPAVDKGTSESVTAGFNKDLDGTAVPTGSAPDIGAYER